MDEYMEVYFHDLADHIQEWLLEVYGIDSEREMNWDVFPITQVYAPDPEPEED